MAPLLSVPLKKTTEVDFTGPVRTWIATTYSSADNPEDPKAVEELNKLRTNALCRPLDKHEQSLELLYRYFDQLTAIEGKIPFSPSSVAVYFKWKDAIDPGSLFAARASVTLASGGLEKAAVLFNIAALMSQIAAEQPLDHDAELKAAAKLYQQAAGAFAHLKDHVSAWTGQEVTADLSAETLSALSTLMLAHAQEAIYLKAARDRMKPQIVAKIACQAAELYGETSKALQRARLRSLWDEDSVAITAAKQAGFTALAHYYSSLISKENKDIGPELSHLTEAKRLLAGGTQTQLFASDAAAVERAYAAAKKDNDFIYHERIPDVKSLPAIDKAVLSKPIPLPKGHLSNNFKDLFGHLVPVQVQQALAAYDVRRKELVQSELGRVREATNLLNGVLASLNLPASLDDAVNKQAVPQSVRDKASAVRAAGGVTDLQRMMTELPSLMQRNKEILAETTRLLDEEKRTDDQLRAQHKDKWTRIDSAKLTEPLRGEVTKYTSILHTAASADETVRQKFAGAEKAMRMLSGSEQQLAEMIPSIVAGGGDASSNPAVGQLRQHMDQVGTMKTDREAIEKELNATPEKNSMANSFLKAMAESGIINEEQLSNDKLNEILTPLRERVTASIQRQEQLLGQIQSANSAFTAAMGASGGAREAVLKDLASGHDMFMELRNNLQEGTKFYNDLTPLLVRLQQKVSDYCFARSTEKEEYVRSLAQGTPATTNQPPARPPPPNISNAAAAPNPPTSAPYPQAAPQHPMPLYNPYQQSAPPPSAAGPYATYPGGAAAGFPPGASGAPTAPGYPSMPYPHPYGQGQPGAPPMPLGYNPYAQAQQQAQYGYQQQQQVQQPYPQMGYPPAQ